MLLLIPQWHVRSALNVRMLDATTNAAATV